MRSIDLLFNETLVCYSKSLLTHEFHEIPLNRIEDLIVDRLYSNLFELNSIHKRLKQGSTTLSDGLMGFSYSNRALFGN